jgi:hypothetical protein
MVYFYCCRTLRLVAGHILHTEIRDALKDVSAKAMLRSNKHTIIYLLIMSIVMMPLQSVWAASSAALNDVFSNFQPDNQAEIIQTEMIQTKYASHPKSHHDHNMGNPVATTIDHCDKQQAQCDQCDNCSHCINLLNNPIVHGAQPLQCFSVGYLNHYHSIEQRSLFRPPIRS